MLGRHPDDRAILLLAFPALGALAADPLYSLIDTALIGNLGTTELGAVALGTTAFTASFWMFSFLAYGVTPKVARALGAGDERTAASTAIQAMFIAGIAGALLAVLGVVFAGPVIGALGGEGDMQAMAVDYLQIRALAAPFVLTALVGHGWLRGAHDTRTPMLVAITGAALNAVLDYLLIYPAGLGVTGAAIATLVSQVLVAAWFLVLLRPRLRAAPWRFDKVAATSLLTVGAELVVRTGSILAATTLATALAARMGAVQLAAWQITFQLFLLLSLLLDSLAIAAQALVAAALGREGGESRRVSNRLLELGGAFGIGLGAILFLLRGVIAQAFTDDPQVVESTADLIGWLGALQPLAAIAFTFDGIFIGALRTRFLAGSMALSSAVFVGVAAGGYAAGWGTAGLAAGATLWMVLRVITTSWLYRRDNWAGSSSISPAASLAGEASP
jgi:putative MATE family efflux protein